MNHRLVIFFLITVISNLSAAKDNGVEFNCKSINTQSIDSIEAIYSENSTQLKIFTSENEGLLKETLLQAERSEDLEAIYYASDIGVLAIETTADIAKPLHRAILYQFPENNQTPFLCARVISQ